MKIHSNVKLLEIDLDWKHFTRHDQHLNLYGKEITFLQSAMITGQFYKRNQLASIHFLWKDFCLDGANSLSQDLNTKDEISMSSQLPKW
jgi:hypothetical protein